MIYESPKIVTGWLHHGDLIYDKNGSYFVVLDCQKIGTLLNVMLGLVYIDRPYSDVKDIIDEGYSIEEKISVVGKMFLWPDGNYHHHTMDDSHNYGTSSKTYAAALPPDNPLRDHPFWEAPGGKNLTILHCLEWAKLHLENEDAKLPCKENSRANEHIYFAIQELQRRQKLRQEQGVLGTMLPHKTP